MDKLFHDLISSISDDNSEIACQILTTHSSRMTLRQITMALIRASARGNLIIAEEALANGADPNGYADQVPLINAVLCNNLQIVKLLIDSKADLNKQDENTYSALMHSVSNQNHKIFDLLIEAGANPELETYDGDTAINIAEKIGDAKKLEQMRKSPK